MSYTVLVLLIVLLPSINGVRSAAESAGGPSFTIDYEQDTFLMDGKPFRYLAS